MNKQTFECNTYEDFISLRAGVEAGLKTYSHKLKQFPRNENGLTPDEVKFSKEYQAIKKQYNFLFRNLQKLNKANVKKFKKQNA